MWDLGFVCFIKVLFEIVIFARKKGLKAIPTQSDKGRKSFKGR